MSLQLDRIGIYLHDALTKRCDGMYDNVRFHETSVPCWRCPGHLEEHYCENGVYALRCNCGCPGVFLVYANNPDGAAREIAGAYVGEIPGGGVPGC